MAGKVRNMINRNGRYHARLVVPKDLRRIIGKSELREPLGGDYRQALKLLPGAVAGFQHRIALAEREIEQKGKSTPRYPLAPDQIAATLYTRRLVQDELMREHPGYASVGIDDVLVNRLRAGVAGNATNRELAELVGAQIEVFRNLGNLDAAPNSSKWREIARALCVAELEALARVAERVEGDFSGVPTAPVILNAQPPENTPAPVSLTKLWESYVRSHQSLGYMDDGGRRQELAVKSLRKFLRHDDAAKVTRKNMADWLDTVLKEKQPSTVSKVYLPTIRSLFRWAMEKEFIEENPALGIRVAAPRAVQNRERGYTTAEATKLLQAVHTYEPKIGHRGTVMEAAKVTAAKRWVPWLCAFTGARVAEITQLRREDIREVEGDLVVRITPEAGGTKSGQWRDVPLHPQIANLGG